MAANRDEFYAREALSAHWWNGVEDVRVFGGRDVEAHGTWLAVADNGRVGAVTNWTEDRSAPKPPGSFMRGAGPSRSPAEGSPMRGAGPSRSPAEGSFMRGAGPSRSPAEGSFMRGAGPSRSPAEGSFMRGAGPSRSPAEGSFMRGAGPSRSPAEGSRGDLPRSFLFGDRSAEDFVATIEGPRYAGFNFLGYDGDELVYTSNRTGEVRVLKPGVYGLTNTRLGPGSIRGRRLPEIGHPHSFDEWPKAVFGAAALERIAGTATTDDLIDLLGQAHVPLETPADRELAPERSYSPCFIHGAEYGTRASTAVIVGNGSIEFAEQAYGPFGEPGARATATIPITPPIAPSQSAKEIPWT